jgi:dephospho-CoA kinase
LPALTVGLTGGIGSGKSTVAHRLAELGAVLIDSDLLAREVVEPGTPGLAAIEAAFGSGVIGPDGALDRPALAARVFADADLRAVLNGIVHPLVRARAASLSRAAPPDAVVVQEVPLLVEVGLAAAFDLVVVVDAPDDDRVSRLVDRGLSAEDARARMATQASREERLEAADYVLDNSGSVQHLLDQVDQLWVELLRVSGLSEGAPTVEP